MQSKVVKMTALLLVLAGVSVVLGQTQYPGARDGVADTPKVPKKARVEEEEQSKPTKPKTPAAKSKLEELLAEALKNNADIRVAAAKLAEADAELNRTRVEVTQKIVTLHHAILSQKAKVDYVQKKYERYQGLLKDRSIDQKLVDEVFVELTAAKAKLAELEAQMPALLGRMVLADFDKDGRFDMDMLITAPHTELQHLQYKKWSKELQNALDRRNVEGPLAERIRKALQTPVKIDYKDTSLAEVFDDLTKKAPGLSIRSFHGAKQIKVTLHFEEALPVSAILQALADDHDLRFSVRDYGIRVTATSNPAPPGALTIEEFLRQKPEEQPRSQPAQPGSGKNPPKENVEGVVKKTDPSGLMTITIGSDAGLHKGHTLELFRLNAAPSQSKYLGTIRILEVSAHESVAQPMGKLTGPAQIGDRVASRIK